LGLPKTDLPGVAPRERSSRPIAAGVDIGHVHLKTADIDRIHHFYVDILGFDVGAGVGPARR
jgi:catechol-2,3-dioxygenase